ncbi:glycosyltransferase [Paenibacillus nanensis]|nr:glycosyltransferase [Paenibacillus nanensis]
MIRIVFNVAAESGGALSVLNDFYEICKRDEDNEYIFVLSKPNLQGSKNVKIIKLPWIKKSWFHRLFFDHFVAPLIIKKNKADEVISLQNTIIPYIKIPQSVLVHNALPFSQYRFSLLENRVLWVYQNVLSRIIFKSIKRADRVIVQTEWMKRKCIQKLNINPNKIQVMRPEINIQVEKTYSQSNNSLVTFFYPASCATFKNHKIIIDACKKLKEEEILNFEVIFTISGRENKHASNLYSSVLENDIPVRFAGEISRDEVLEYFTKSILLFPSYIETVGLPLVEAKRFGTPILASSSEYAEEVLKDYNNVRFFNPFKSDELLELMKRKILN